MPRDYLKPEIALKNKILDGLALDLTHYKCMSYNHSTTANDSTDQKQIKTKSIKKNPTNVPSLLAP